MPSRAVGPVAPAMIQFVFSSLGTVALQKLASDGTAIALTPGWEEMMRLVNS